MCLYKQDSEYASGPKYVKILLYDKVLNMAGFSICERYVTFGICENMREYVRILNMTEF